jgi:hypothetical protein
MPFIDRGDSRLPGAAVAYIATSLLRQFEQVFHFDHFDGGALLKTE